MPDQPNIGRELIERRSRHMAGGYLFYDEPVHLVRGDGVWLYDAAGRRYLDCYNNVSSVGHANRRVLDATTRQAELLNVHDRYPVSYTHLTLPTICFKCRSRWSPYH